jgi:hypothetical protein
VLNRPTGQKGSNNVTNAETLHHFLNSGIDNFHDITRPNIDITLDCFLFNRHPKSMYSRAQLFYFILGSMPKASGFETLAGE